MIVAATNNPEINSEISQLARRHKKLINCVTSAEEYNIMFSAILRFEIGIIMRDSDPKLAREVKERLSRIAERELSDYLRE